MPDSQIDWNGIAARPASQGLSPYYREQTVEILSRVELLGPLGDAVEEFGRVYRFLHYNEPHHIRRVVRALMERTNRTKGRLRIRHNAWRYTVAVYDEWIGHARIFYTVAGLLEGALRSRLNDRMTTRIGERWFDDEAAVPSTVRESNRTMKRAERMQKVERWLDRLDRGELSEIEFLKLVKPHRIPPSSTSLDNGQAFVASLTLFGLQQFFTTPTLFNGKAQLKELLVDPDSGDPVPMASVEAELTRYREARNAVAHYDLAKDLSFAQALFTATKIARWLKVDLQHFYSSVDVRQSTELSRLLGPLLPKFRSRIESIEKCATTGCTVGGPYDVMIIGRTPADGTDLTTTEARSACPFHRVQYRVEQHHHV